MEYEVAWAVRRPVNTIIHWGAFLDLPNEARPSSLQPQTLAPRPPVRWRQPSGHHTSIRTRCLQQRTAPTPPRRQTSRTCSKDAPSFFFISIRTSRSPSLSTLFLASRLTLQRVTFLGWPRRARSPHPPRPYTPGTQGGPRLSIVPCGETASTTTARTIRVFATCSTTTCTAVQSRPASPRNNQYTHRDR